MEHFRFWVTISGKSGLNNTVVPRPGGMRVALESAALAVRQELACQTQTTKSDIANLKSADL